MDINEIKRIILDQKEEIEFIFKNEKIVDRELNISGSLAHPNVVVIIGPRRAGKSFLSLLSVRDKKFAYINFDDERLSFKPEELNQVLESFYELYGDLDYIILDEIQNVSGWELFVSRLRRTKRVIITGPNSKLLSQELSTHLTGRHIDYNLLPFSFREHLKMKESAVLTGGALSTRHKAEIRREFDIYIQNGGFPEVFKFGRPILKSIYEDIIYKDIILRFKIRKTTSFKELARVLSAQYSREFTYSKLKTIVGIKDIHTLKKFVDYLRSAYLFIVVERFSYKLKQQILAPRKIYSVDTGMIHAMAFRSSEDKGRLYENIAAIELQRKKFYHNNLEIYYWKNSLGEEVDFCLKSGLKVRELLQVCCDTSDIDTKRRELKSLLKAGTELRCDSLLVLTDNYEAQEIHQGKKIHFMPIWQWLLRGSKKFGDMHQNL